MPFSERCPFSAAPEVIAGSKTRYSGESADVWSCGVFLFVMLFHCYPFERSNDPKGARGFKIVRPLVLSTCLLTGLYSAVDSWVTIAIPYLAVGEKQSFPGSTCDSGFRNAQHCFWSHSLPLALYILILSYIACLSAHPLFLSLFSHQACTQVRCSDLCASSLHSTRRVNGSTPYVP